jgi:acylphosphatase
VFFRASCLSEARARGLGGWVRNLPGGGLEAAFEGTERDVKAMIDWCRRGPPAARVDHVEVIDEAPVGDSSFGVVG